jgi:AcrR family transcriptional regulator
LTRAEQQAETRRRLLDAAIEVFAKRGLHEATLEEISEAAGYSRGAVYSNFAGKDELLLTVFEERIEPRLRETMEPMVEATDASEQAEAAARLVGALLAQERDYVQLLLEFWGLAARHERVAGRFAAVRRRRRAMVSDMIEMRVARRDAGDGPAPDVLAAGFVALTVGILFEALVDRELDAEGVQATLFELIARGAGRSGRRD